MSYDVEDLSRDFPHLAQPETVGNLPEVCPNCGSVDREMEPRADENGALTSLLEVICTGCGYRLGEIPLLAPSEDAEDSEKSLEMLPRPGLDE